MIALPANSRNVLLVLVFFAVSFPLGYLGANQYKETKVTDTRYPKDISESEVPVASDLIENPNITDWSARVKGKVTTMSENSFTITDIVEEFGEGVRTIKLGEGAELEVKYVEGQTSFRKDPQTEQDDPEAQPLKAMDFNSLAIGDIVNGTVELIKNQEGEFEAVGGSFTVRSL